MTASHQCEKRCKPNPLPPSFPVEKARLHPSLYACLEPGARCALPAGHAGPHRVPGLAWHDPPVLYVGGERVGELA